MKSSQKKFPIRAAVTLAIFLLGLAAIHLKWGHIFELDSIKSHQAEFESAFHHSPFATMALYFLVYILMTALSIPGATVLTLIGGAVFGFAWAAFLVSFGSSIGALLAFLASRYFLQDWVRSRFEKRFTLIDETFRRDGALYLLTLRLLPLFPFFLVNLLMGLTTMGARTFYLLSQIGMLPATLIYVNAGTQLGQIRSLHDLASPTVLGSLLILGLFPIAVKFLLCRRP